VSRGAASIAERSAGILVPLFALRGGSGIGEIGDVAPFCAWLAAAGHRVLQLLPILEMSLGERSPYAAMSAFAIDPIYITGPAAQAPHDAVGIDSDTVRAAKRRALEESFASFLADDSTGDTAPSAAFQRFRDREAYWLEDYALFRACQERHDGRAWMDWEPALRDREPAALAAARAALVRERLFHEYANGSPPSSGGGACRCAAAGAAEAAIPHGRRNSADVAAGRVRADMSSAPRLSVQRRRPGLGPAGC
jgi:4-alpha-glucanotransferase